MKIFNIQKSEEKERKETIRPIDELAEETYSWWGKTFVFIKKTKIKTWQGVFVVAFLAGAAAAIVWSVSLNIEPKTNASQYGSAVLTWNANSEPDLACYRVYYDTVSHSGNCPGGYGSKFIDVGNITTYAIGTHAGDPNLIYGQTYYFAVTARDTSNNESGCATQVSKLIDSPIIVSVSSGKPDGTYGVGEVVDIDVTFSEAVTSTGNVTVTLETGSTDRTCTFSVSNSTTGTCNYTVQAGDTSSDLNVNSISGVIKDRGQNEMTSFTPGTNLAANKNLIINTAGPSGPTISNISSSNITSNGATITWTTNEVADSQVEYGLTTNYGSQTTLDTNKVTSHSQNISGLSAGATYHYRVKSRNNAGSLSSSPDNSFTAGGVADNTPPTIANISSNKPNAYYKAGSTIDVDVTFSEAVTSSGAVTVTLETGTVDRSCSFAINNSDSGSCNYTVQTGDTSNDLNAKSVSGTISDQSNNAITNFTPASNLSANKNLIIDTKKPTGSIKINNGASSTTSRYVTLNLQASDSSGMRYMRFSNNQSKWSPWYTYSTKYSNWDLTKSMFGGTSSKGAKRVYAQFKDKAGNSSSVYSDSITYK